MIVKTQKPAAAKLDLWDDYGSPVERIAVTDSRWTWKGSWEAPPAEWKTREGTKVSWEKGAEASVRFNGTGAIVTGFYLPTGGKADVYLDGALSQIVDVYPDEDARKTGDPSGTPSASKSGNTPSVLSCAASHIPEPKIPRSQSLT